MLLLLDKACVFASNLCPAGLVKMAMPILIWSLNLSMLSFISSWMDQTFIGVLSVDEYTPWNHVPDTWSASGGVGMDFTMDFIILGAYGADNGVPDLWSGGTPVHHKKDPAKMVGWVKRSSEAAYNATSPSCFHPWFQCPFQNFLRPSTFFFHFYCYALMMEYYPIPTYFFPYFISSYEKEAKKLLAAKCGWEKKNLLTLSLSFPSSISFSSPCVTFFFFFSFFPIYGCGWFYFWQWIKERERKEISSKAVRMVGGNENYVRKSGVSDWGYKPDLSNLNLTFRTIPFLMLQIWYIYSIITVSQYNTFQF